MKEDEQPPLEYFDKRLSSTEKRIDDIKWFIGGVTGFFTIIFSVLTIIANMNLNSEKVALREFQRDLKIELGKIESPPKLELLGTDGAPLANQEVPVTFQKEKDGNYSVVFSHALKNVGSSLSGPLYEKIYSKDPIEFYSRSTDEQKFEYEAYLAPGDLSPNEIPGNYSTEWRLTLSLARTEIPPPGKYVALIKLFYGKGQVVQAPFWMVVSKVATAGQ